MKTNIVVTLQHEAVHQWPDCNIDEVDFLKHPHRHIFHITCKKEVGHNDRAIEIIKFKREIQGYLIGKYGNNLGSRSCEMVAHSLVSAFSLSYCQVLEDGENGAEVQI